MSDSGKRSFSTGQGGQGKSLMETLRSVKLGKIVYLLQAAYTFFCALSIAQTKDVQITGFSFKDQNGNDYTNGGNVLNTEQP